MQNYTNENIVRITQKSEILGRSYKEKIIIRFSFIKNIISTEDEGVEQERQKRTRCHD